MPHTLLKTRESLREVRYDIRGELSRRARELEGQGRQLIRLNIGNPGAFGFRAPEHLQRAIADHIASTDPYTHQQGLPAAREAIARFHKERGTPNASPERVFIGNGVSELIDLSLRALLNPGDEVLLPSPDYPLWSAATILNDGRPVYYSCLPENGFLPDPEEIESLVSSRTRAIVLINPNNPTGAVYSKEVLLDIVELARQHNLVLFSDEIYDKILYDDAVHICTASLAPDVLCLTFNGLSKSYRIAGFRSGWVAISGPKHKAQSYIEGIDMLANMRLCANVPSQHAIQTALGGYQSINDLVLPNGRLLEQRNRTWELLNDIPGVSCVKPMGALYAFPKIDPKVCPIHNDEKFVLDLLLSEKLLIVQGTAFNWPWPDHFRVVTLPRVDELEMAIGRIGSFLKTYQQ